MPGTPVTILASGTLLLTGYVRDVAPSHDGARHQHDARHTHFQPGASRASTNGPARVNVVTRQNARGRAVRTASLRHRGNPIA